MRNKKIFIIFILFTLIFSFIILFPSCKKKTNIKDEEFIIEEEQTDQQYIEIPDENDKIDWDKEKERLKNIGKLDIRTFSTITVIIFREVKDLKTKLENKKYSEKQIKAEISKKREELFNYFGITKEIYNKYYQEHKTEIDNFIASHPSYYGEIEVEEGF